MNMDWASNEWKQSLSSVALQKVNTLEETVARFQKERQQKQLQCECLELALDKEKRKVDEGKQQYVQLERQLQSLADTNKSFENKTSKLQNEIQSRDLRINSLESLLSQAKKENSRLQQLEKDIEELQCLKESAQQEVVKLKQEQNVGKKDSVISELEQQIKALQKSQNRENSLLDISDVKENIKNIINSSCTQDYQSFELDSLKEKVSEQENIIKELRKKLNTQDRAVLESVPNTFPNTPAKARGSFIDSPPKSAKKSAWNSFGSTPMKEYRGFRHHSDSSTFNSTEEEKIQFLQLRVKQLCQELECQRHNSEASKNSLEQKMKEKENALKAEIKHQAQVIADMDKELKEIRNKYQQDISQASKKLDLTTLQLSKAEQIKVQLEADKKSLDMKINAYEFSLKQKEGELEEIQKAKLSCEEKKQALISENSELEKSCKVLQDKNNSLTEEMKTLQLQLEGSNNLVKEKENAYHSIKKELEILSKSHGLLEAKAQQLEDKVAVTEAENAHLEAKICDYSLKEGILNEKIEILEKEKKEFLMKIAVESDNVQVLESKIKELTLTLNEVEGNLSSKVADFESLSKEMLNSRDSYEKKVRELEDAAVAENKTLEAKIEEYSLSEVMLKEKIELLEKEKKEVLNEAAAKADKVLTLESNIKELNTALNKAREDLSFKTEELEHLGQEMANLKDMYQAKAQELEDAVAATKAENVNLKDKICDYSLNEGILKEKMEILEKEKKEFLMKIAIEFDNVQTLESKIEELTLTLKKVEDDLSSKVADFEKMSIEMLNTRDSYENKVRELEDAVNASEAENNSLEAKIEEYSLSEAMLKEQIELLEKEKKEVLNEAAAEAGNVLTLESNVKELNTALNKAREDLSLKTEELEQLSQEMANLKDIYQNKVGELEDAVTAAVAENKTLEGRIEEYSLSEAMLKEKIELLEREKEKVLNDVAAKDGKVLSLESNIKELNIALNEARECLTLKTEELGHLSQEISNLKEIYENKVGELEDAVTAAVAENKTLEGRIEEYSLSEAMLKEKTELLEKEKEKVLNDAAAKDGKVLTLEANIEELNIALNEARECLSLKTEELGHLSQEISNLKEIYENKVRELEDAVSAFVAENKTLEAKIEEYSLSEAMLQEQIELLEKKKKEVLNEAAAEAGNVLTLESNIKELNAALNKAGEDLSLKAEELEHLNQEVSNLKEMYENKVQQLEDVVAAAMAESKTLEAKIKEYSLSEAMLKEKIELLEKEKEEVLNEAAAEGDKVLTLESNIKELNTVLNEARDNLSIRAEELEHLRQEISNLKEIYENKVQQLEDVVAVAVGERKTLEDKIEEYSLNEAMLKEKIELLEKEKEDVQNDAAAEGGKVLYLESNITELNTALNEAREVLSLKTEELEHLSQEISNLKEMHENKVRQLEDVVAVGVGERKTLEDKIEEYSLNEAMLKEKIKLLEKEKEQVLNEAADEGGKLLILESNIKELNAALNEAREVLSLKMQELEHLSQEISNLKEIYENKVRQLEDVVAVGVGEKKTLEEKIEEYSLNEAMLKEKIELLEKEKEEVLNDAAAVGGKVQTLESNFKELNTVLNEAREVLSLKTEELDHLSQEISNLKDIYENEVRQLEDVVAAAVGERKTLEDKLEEYSLNEVMLKEKIQFLEKEKEEIQNDADFDGRKVLTLEFNIKELNTALNEAREVLSLKTKELEHLGQEISNLNEMHKNKVRQLEDVVAVGVGERKTLKDKLEEYSLSEAMLKEKIELLEKEKEDVQNDAAAEGVKVLTLESNIKELNTALNEAREILSLKTEELKHLSQEISNLKEIHENKVRQLEDVVAVAVGERKNLEDKIEEYSLNEAMLKEKIELLEKEKEDVRNDAAAEGDKVLYLESNITELNTALNEAREVLSLKTEELEHLSQEISNLKEMHENKVQQLEDVLSGAVGERKTLEDRIEEYSLSEAMLKEKIELLEKEKEDVRNDAAAEGVKVLTLESTIKELNTALNEAQGVISLKTEELEHLSHEISNLKEMHEKEKKEIQNGAASDGTKVLTLELNIKELNTALNEAREVLSLKTEELEHLSQEISNLKKIHDNEIKQLQSDITEAKSKISFLETHIKMVETSKRALEEKLAQLQIEEERLLNSVASETEKTFIQNKRLEELTSSIEDLQIQLSLKTEEYDELKRELTNAKSFTENINSELEEAKSAISYLENQVKELELSNKSLNEKFLSEKMEKDRINGELAFRIENTDLLDSALQEQQTSTQRLQAKVLEKEEECKQLSLELANLQVLHEEKIHEHEDQLSSCKSEKVLLENQLAACLRKQNLLREKLESFAIAKSIVHGLLSAETSKVQMLEIGLGEIKTDLINLQSVLSQSDAQFANYSSKKGDQKDSMKKSLCKICLFKNRNPGITLGLQQNMNSIEFGSGIREDFRLIRNSALTYQNLKEKTCFPELNESTLNTFTYLCYLEKNLADKLTICKFLVCHKLLDDKSLFDVCLTAFHLRKHLQTIANLKNISYYILQKTNRDSLRVDIYLNEILNLFSSILSKSKPFDNKKQIERPITETSVQLQDNLKSIMLFISKYVPKTLKNIELYIQFLDKFENIHCNNSHLPVIKNTNYVLCINKINNAYISHEILNSEHSSQMQKDLNLVNFNQNLNFKELIRTASASYCSVLLNFAVCVFEEGIPKIPSDNLSNISSNFKYSLLSHEELNSLCLLIHSYSNGDPIQSCINNIINSGKLGIIDMYSKYKNMKFNECNFGAIVYDKNKFDLSELFSKDVKEIICEIEKLKHEIACAQKRIDTLQHCYEVEKMKNNKLSIVIEEEQNELSQVYLEKEKLKMKFLDAKELFTHVQNLISFKSGLSAMEIDIDSFSKSCFCEICETGSDGTCSLDEYQHDILKPINLLKSLIEFIATHNNLKTEIEQIQRNMFDFQVENADLHSKIAELKTDLEGMTELKTEIEQMRTDVFDFQVENTVVQCTDTELKADLEGVTDSLKLKEKAIVISNSECDRLTKISEDMSSLNCKRVCSILEPQEIETRLDNSVINKSEKLNVLDKALHAENTKTNLCPNYKEKEILIFQNSIQEREKALEQMSLKCENYEKEINDLNAKLYRYKVDKEVLQASEQQSKKFISELQKKIKSLEQSKISLNLTIENAEEELQSIYSEKQELQNKLDELTIQTNNSSKRKDLEHDILFWKDKYEEEKKAVDILSRNLQELEKLKQDNEIYCEELKNRNKLLETDVMILKNIKFEHECALLEKTSISEYNLITITQLKQKILDIETEKLELESKIKEVEVNLYCKQETEIALLKEIQDVKNELQSIKVEKLREAANYKKEICGLEKEREKIKICIEELSEECNTLKLKLKDMIEDKKEDGKIIEELKKKVHSESINMQNELQEVLKKQHEKEKITLKKLNQELEEAHAAVKKIKAINCELNTEISLLKANETSQAESYKNQYDDLFTKFIHLQVENQDLKLKISSNSSTFNNNSSSELQNAKTALATAKKFIVKILNLIINVIESYSLHEEYETAKSDLIFFKTAWEQSIEVLLKSEFKLQNDIPTWLVSFFRSFNFNKEIQVMLQNISKSIHNFASETEDHPETFISKQMSFGEYINDIKCDSNFTVVSLGIITELLHNLRLLQQTFCKLKELIWKKQKEMNQQNEMLEEMSLKFKAAVSDEQKNKHGNPPDPKFNLIRLNYRRLEKKHEKLLKTCEEMEQRIKGLEEEKQNLENEVEEMESKLKGSDSSTNDCSSELFNTLVVLGEVKKQNSHLERENKWLKSVLQEVQSSSKNHEDKESSYATCTGKLPSNNSETSKF